jgi:hypothetical protein
MAPGAARVDCPNRECETVALLAVRALAKRCGFAHIRNCRFGKGGTWTLQI